jgi:hypothetical protein
MDSEGDSMAESSAKRAKSSEFEARTAANKAPGVELGEQSGARKAPNLVIAAGVTAKRVLPTV